MQGRNAIWLSFLSTVIWALASLSSTSGLPANTPMSRPDCTITITGIMIWPQAAIARVIRLAWRAGLILIPISVETQLMPLIRWGRTTYP